MKSRGQNQKITQIISLSQNYKIHRHNIESIKPAIDSFSRRRVKQVDKAATQRLRYRQAARGFNNTALIKQNERMSSRLSGILMQDRRKKPTQYSPFQTNSPRNQQSLASSRSSKRLTSMSSQRSLTSVSSNFRQRTLRQKEIQRQNTKLAARITNPKTVRTLALKQLNKSYQKQQEIMKTRSRFSQKNQEIIRSLALHGLKFDRKDVQYLPQLSSKRKSPLLRTEKSKSKILP